MNKEDLDRIGQVLNCGGEGGTPGPCPISGDSAFKPGSKVRFSGGIFMGKSAKVVETTSEGVVVQFPNFKKAGKTIKGGKFMIPHTSNKPTMSISSHLRNL